MRRRICIVCVGRKRVPTAIGRFAVCAMCVCRPHASRLRRIGRRLLIASSHPISHLTPPLPTPFRWHAPRRPAAEPSAPPHSACPPAACPLACSVRGTGCTAAPPLGGASDATPARTLHAARCTLLRCSAASAGRCPPRCIDADADQLARRPASMQCWHASVHPSTPTPPRTMRSEMQPAAAGRAPSGPEARARAGCAPSALAPPDADDQRCSS